MAQHILTDYLILPVGVPNKARVTLRHTQLDYAPAPLLRQ